jgi:octaprenyl-diphosphate synthase
MPSSIQLKLIINQFDKTLGSIIHEDLKIIKEIKKYVIESGGKRIRPVTHYFLVNLLNYDGEQWKDVGAIAELIHAASLLHDDVVDNADTRRGKPTIGNKYGNKTAILMGDYLLACGIEHLNRLDNPALMSSYTKVIRSLSVGELVQMQWEKDPNISIKEYEQIIYGKTASLFEAVSETAGILARANTEMLDSLRQFGCSLGRVFQIRDDLLDYLQSGKESGKVQMKDFLNGLYTYPVILLKLSVNKQEKKKLVDVFSKEVKNSDDSIFIRSLLEKYSIFTHIQTEISHDIDKLISFLNQFEKSDFRDTMIERIEELKIPSFV